MVAADGIVDVRGRGDDAVQTGAATVHVSDVEHVLRQAPGVHDVAVLGVRHATLGAVVGYECLGTYIVAALALLADLVLDRVQRHLTPWNTQQLR